MKIVAQIIRILIGCLFIFSGAVKLNDPYGTAYMLNEYFEVFSADFSPIFHHFLPYTLFLSVVLCAFEVILGIAILLNYKMSKTIFVALLLTIFFTFLTFYSFYFDKVKECGCFGTVIKMSPLESFYKNVVTLFLILVIYARRHDFKPFMTEKKVNLVMLGVLLFTFGIGYYIVEHLPLIDNLNYKVGNHLPKLMQPEERPKYKWIMEKDGKEYEFGDSNYPTDPAYKYKRHELIGDSTKFVPKIVGFRVENEEGDKTIEALTGKKLFIVIPYAEKAGKNCSGKCMEKINNLINTLEKSKSVETMVLTGHSNAIIFNEYRHEVQLAAPYYFVDETILKTMVRSNPGLILMQDGTVKGKWHYNDTPDSEEIGELLK